MRKSTEIHFKNILDTMSGADGGVGFVKFKCLIEDIDKQAATRDESAEELIKILKNFSKLIFVSQKD